MSLRKSMRIASSDSRADTTAEEQCTFSRYGRKRTPCKNRGDYYLNGTPSKSQKSMNQSGSSKNTSPSDEYDAEGAEDAEDAENRIENADALFDAKSDVAGREVFAINTPKKRDGMKNLAKNTPKTPVTALKTMSLNTPETPSTALKKMSLDSPRNPRINSLRAQQNLFTPTETRDKNKRVLQKRTQKSIEVSESESSADEHSDYDEEDSSESSDEESVDATSDDDDSPTKFVNTRKTMPSTAKVSAKVNTTQITTRTRGRPKKKTCDDDFIPDSDNYFMTASNKKIKTSDHTLDRLKSSRLQHEELFNLLNSINSSAEHQKRIVVMLDELRQNFGRWMLEMQKGYNIIVYGTGSKQQLLHEFCEVHLADKPLIVVNGFFPSLTVKDILQAIKVQLLELTANSRNDHEVVDLISSALDSAPNTHIFLVINNIDGVMLRKTKDQHIISRLAKIKNLHLIASIDHINAPLMWDQTCMDNFNFVWYDCTTMLPYKNETAFENSVFFQNSGELDLAAMSNVFRSLTTNARGIYMILVKNQLANQKDSNYQGMTFKELYQKCRESFLVSSDSTLRTQLIEFVDHKMAKIKRSHDATELVSIPISAQILLLFTQQHNE